MTGNRGIKIHTSLDLSVAETDLSTGNVGVDERSSGDGGHRGEESGNSSELHCDCWFVVLKGWVKKE